MKLSRLIAALTDGQRPDGENRFHGSPPRDVGSDPDILSIHYRAQDVRPGGLFFAISGRAADGHDHIDTAIANGARAVVVERPDRTGDGFVRVRNSRRAMGELAARFYGDPARRLFMIGITGTNGKTTTAYLIESVLRAAGLSVGVMGTINCRYAGRAFKSPVTTPESVDLQRMLADMRHAGVTHVVMEVSSHGIDLERVSGCRYDIGVFTNLTQDHLDYHGTMDAYWHCKQRLFTRYLKSTGSVSVINCDDARGAALGGELKTPLLTVGRASGCRVRPRDETFSLDGIHATVDSPDGPVHCRSALVGRHNLENILCAVGAGAAMGMAPETIQRGVSDLAAVPGRLEPVGNRRGMFVFVDYAHTPDALENALSALRAVTRKRILCVFGCGGDRDRDKRPRMGRIAGERSDLAVVTSDNPRTENPMAIIDQIQAGLDTSALRRYAPDQLGHGFQEPGYVVEPDRKAAIGLAVRAAVPGDTILIAGKGHETYQIIGAQTRDFDDRKEAREALEAVS